MIATAGQAAKVRHTLAGSTPPSALAATLYAPDGTIAVAEFEIAPPILLAVSSGRATTATDEAILPYEMPDVEEGEDEPTLTAKPGDLARAVDVWGTVHDCVLVGYSDDEIKVASFGGDPTEIESVWFPEILIELDDDAFATTGPGYRLEVEADGDKTQIHIVAGKLSLDISISPREYMDMAPGAVADLADIESRADWPRLVREAVAEVESKLLAQDRITSAIIGPVPLRRCVAAALHKLLGISAVPPQFQGDARAWLEHLRSQFASAMRDCMGAAYYDADMSGTISASEKLPTLGHRRVRW